MNIDILLSFLREIYHRGYTDGYTDCKVQLDALQAKDKRTTSEKDTYCE